MARNKDFFVNSAPKRDRSFFVKEEPKKTDIATTKNINSNIINGKDKYNSVLRAPVKQDFGDKIGNFFMNTIPNAAEDLWDDIKEPFVGKSEKQLLTEAKLSPKMLVEDAKIQLAKENPTREDYALVKQTQDIIKKYGTDESNIRAISEDTTQLQKDLGRAEKTWQASPVDAAVANTGAAVTGIFGNLGSFANSLGADKVPLLREVTNFAVNGARKAQENAQQYNKGNYGEALGTVTQGVVNLVPYFLIGTGSTAVKGATTVSKYGKYIEPIIKNPSFWYSLTSMWGQKYQEKLDEGYNRFQALGNAILYAFPASLIEVSGGIGAKGKEAQSLLRTMGEEIAEEIAQDIMSGVSDKITTNHDLPVFSMTEDAIINPKQLGKTALYTAPIVAIGGGANNVINNSVNNRIENQKAQAQINQDLQSNKNVFNEDFSELKNTSNVRNVLQNVPKTENLQQANRLTPQNVAQNQNAEVQLENVKGLPEISVRKLLENQNNKQPNVTLPNQAEMVQNANMGQIVANNELATQRDEQTLQSAKLAGMTDMDIQKAKELNNMLRSGTRLNFYDEKTIPQNVQADKAKIANGFYKDGTLWINKNSKNKVEQILGHELTHHLETTDSYTDLSNTILDSEVFYDFIAEKGYANVAEYKTKLKEMGYNDAQLDNELVARFVEEKMFTDQKSIDRLARQNTKLVEKIKNWISDLVVSFKGTAQEKELRRIENMYRKALEQSRNSTNAQNLAYSIKEDANGKFVKVDTDQDIFEGINEKDYNKIAKMYMQDYLKGTTKLTSNDETIIDTRGIRKYTNPQQRTAYFDEKMFLTPELKNVLEIAEKVEVSEANKDNSKYDNWEYYKFNFEIGDRTFEGLINIGIDKNGYKHFYEINKIHPIGISSVSTNSTNRMYSNNSINQNNSSVNTEYAQENKKDTAGKELAFSMPENNVIQGIKEQREENYWSSMPEVVKTRFSNDYGYIDIMEKADGANSIYSTYVKPEYRKQGLGTALLQRAINKYGKDNLVGQFSSEQSVKNAYKLGFRTSDNLSLEETIKRQKEDSSVYMEYKSDTYSKVKESDKVSFSIPETDNQGRTLSKEQQEFFKDSKVRDENGNLLVVYHATDSKFYTFDKEKIGSQYGGLFGKGFYFATSHDSAESYGEYVGEYYLNVTNPFQYYTSNKDYIVNMLDKSGYDYDKDFVNSYNYDDMWDDDFLDNFLSQAVRGENVYEIFSDMVQKAGFDGIWADEEIVAFEPNQIKNIDNTNPTENPDIRYSMNPVEVAKKTSNTKALSRYAQTLQSKHQDIPEQINLIQKEVDNGNFTHEVIHDKRSLNYAQKYIEENGFEDAVNHWNELIKRGKPVDKDELALGQTIYNVAVDNKDTKLVMKMASDLVQEYTEIGRNLQSATLLRKMTPDGRLYALERSVQKINQDLMQKFDDFENIQIPEELADELLRSETQKDMDAAVEKIQEYIASKIPATWQEKLNSWRYLAMLGNPRTHIRNIVGNAVFIPAVEMKNALAQVGELAISKDQRTKAIVTSLSKKDAKLLKYAENDFDNNKETIRGENKYDIKAGVQEKRTIYSWKAVEAARKGNFNLLEAEDALFLKYRYKKAFAGALKARGITIEQLRENSPETVRKVSEIRSYAINEAQKATYRDASKVAAMVSRGKRKLLNAANQSTGASKLGYNLAYLGAEGVMPFAKTPINIVKRGIEYSPAGLLNGIKDAALNVKNGKKTAAQAIDEIAAGATGTAIAGLGLFLASLGLVSGGEEDKGKEQALKELKGNQNYSFNAFGQSYTIDWTAPSSIPLFIGVELYNSINSEDESAYLNALSNLVEPVVEMSMLQGINDTLKTMGEENAIGNIVSKTLMNYLGQYNPTLLGQIARTFDPVRRTTYVDKNIPVPAAAQRFIQQQAAKIPGVSRMLPTYKDQFGQEQLTDGVINRIVQNFFSPGYLKDIKEGTVEQGLTELYEKTGETSVIPSYASKTLTHNGEKINLTAKQYDAYAKTRGDLSKKGLEGLFKDNYYKSLSDEQKVKVVEAIYDYAGKIAKTKVIDDYELEFNDKKIQKLQNEGLDFYKYILLKKTADTDGNDYTSNDELDKAIKKYGLSRWQKTIKEKNTKSTKATNTLPTLSQQRAKLPTLKK